LVEVVKYKPIASASPNDAQLLAATLKTNELAPHKQISASALKERNVRKVLDQAKTIYSFLTNQDKH